MNKIRRCGCGRWRAGVRQFVGKLWTFLYECLGCPGTNRATISVRRGSLLSCFAAPRSSSFSTRSASASQLTCDALASASGEARMVEPCKCGWSLVPRDEEPTYPPRKPFTVTHTHAWVLSVPLHPLLLLRLLFSFLFNVFSHGHRCASTGGIPGINGTRPESGPDVSHCSMLARHRLTLCSRRGSA